VGARFSQAEGPTDRQTDRHEKKPTVAISQTRLKRTENCNKDINSYGWDQIRPWGCSWSTDYTHSSGGFSKVPRVPYTDYALPLRTWAACSWKPEIKASKLVHSNSLAGIKNQCLLHIVTNKNKLQFTPLFVNTLVFQQHVSYRRYTRGRVT
jgi:hypothetical protein